MFRLNLLGIPLLSVLLAALCTNHLASAAQPNIIFVLADDLGYGDLSCYGQTHFTTPHLDRMAAEGLKFSQHYAGSTVCAPSRACLLTGQHTGHVHQRANGPVAFREDPQDLCVAKWLQDAGYHTAMIGKSGLSCRSDDAMLPYRKGFDHFFGFISHGAAHRHYPVSLWLNGKQVKYPGNHGKEGDTYSGDLFIDDALAFVEQHGRQAEPGRPFFLHLALQHPHLDLAVPEKWREPYRGQFKEKPIGSKKGHFRHEKQPMATFAGMIAHLDDSIGRLLSKLREEGLAENTLVLFASDNGAVTAGGWKHTNFDSSGPLRGCKRDLYEGGVRVPMIAWWPGTIAAGRQTDHVSTFWDFAPTACELAGAPAPANTDGLSYVPTLLNQGSQPEHDYLYWEFHEQGGKQAVRLGQWKGIRLNAKKEPNAPLELYNLSNDLGEQHDVSAEHPDVVAQIAALMKQAHTEHPRYHFGGQ